MLRSEARLYVSPCLQPTRKDQAAALLELLLRKDNTTFISFYNSLVKEAYDDLANLLYDDLPRTSPETYKNSSDGYTPYGEKKPSVPKFLICYDILTVCNSVLTDIFSFCLTVQTILSEGGVPPRPVVFVSRPEHVNQIREKLYRLQKDPGWVTVFGMAGSGKSVLAAEAVRHQSIIEGFFFLSPDIQIIVGVFF